MNDLYEKRAEQKPKAEILSINYDKTCRLHASVVSSILIFHISEKQDHTHVYHMVARNKLNFVDWKTNSSRVTK